MGRPLYVHVGSRKTGTSALQTGLRNSVEALRAAGLALPLVGRPPHVRMILQPLGWTDPAGYVGPIDRSALRRLGAQLREAPGERVVLSVEDLAEAESAHIAAFIEVAEAEELDVNVIITARDWAQQLPSEWQQSLKERVTIDYATYLTHVRDRDTPEGDRFWRRQDVLDIAERWSAGIGRDAVHVVVVPPASIDPNAVARLFGDVIGFDPSLIKMPAWNVNASFGYIEAETLRRLNIALGDRLSDVENEYLPAMRSVLIRRMIARNASPPTPLPPEHVEWVRRTAEERRDLLLGRFSVHGDHTLLVPPPDVGRPIPQVRDDEIADAALRTLANFAVAQFEASRVAPAPPGSRPLASAFSVRFARVRSRLRARLARGAAAAGRVRARPNRRSAAPGQAAARASGRPGS